MSRLHPQSHQLPMCSGRNACFGALACGRMHVLRAQVYGRQRGRGQADPSPAEWDISMKPGFAGDSPVTRMTACPGTRPREGSRPFRAESELWLCPRDGQEGGPVWGGCRTVSSMTPSALQSDHYQVANRRRLFPLTESGDAEHTGTVAVEVPPGRHTQSFQKPLLGWDFPCCFVVVIMHEIKLASDVTILSCMWTTGQLAFGWLWAVHRRSPPRTLRLLF